jgi:hemerythrin-like domain-containing protein
MKRSEELAPLSRDHHHGLVTALKLSRATPADASAARAAFLAFWADEGRHHFAVEEEVVLPGFARHVASDDDAIVRVLVEHVDLRRRAQALADTDTPALADLHELGARLRAHIRYEEDELFQLIEKSLPHDELVALGAAIALAEPH